MDTSLDLSKPVFNISLEVAKLKDAYFKSSVIKLVGFDPDA
jgi:hypothetical protein